MNRRRLRGIGRHREPRMRGGTLVLHPHLGMIGEGFSVHLHCMSSGSQNTVRLFTESFASTGPPQLVATSSDVRFAIFHHVRVKRFQLGVACGDRPESLGPAAPVKTED